MQITAAFMEKADGAVTRRNIKPEAVELEDPREDKVLIKVTSRDACGTDQGIIHGLEPVPAPGVLGHDGAGIVGAIDDSDDHEMITPILRMR
jgi:aryl-alcohol dehydrogenase